MERNFLRIDKAAITGKKSKIACRNSYERKKIYDYASDKGLICRSIIDYTQMYTNQKVRILIDSHCCTECDTFEARFTATPHSFVEINSKTNEKQVIGNPQLLPSPLIFFFYGTSFYRIKQGKEQFKKQQQVLIAPIQKVCIS